MYRDLMTNISAYWVDLEKTTSTMYRNLMIHTKTGEFIGLYIHTYRDVMVISWRNMYGFCRNLIAWSGNMWVFFCWNSQSQRNLDPFGKSSVFVWENVYGPNIIKKLYCDIVNILLMSHGMGEFFIRLLTPSLGQKMSGLLFLWLWLSCFFHIWGYEHRFNSYFGDHQRLQFQPILFLNGYMLDVQWTFFSCCDVCWWMIIIV